MTDDQTRSSNRFEPVAYGEPSRRFLEPRRRMTLPRILAAAALVWLTWLRWGARGVAVLGIAAGMCVVLIALICAAAFVYELAGAEEKKDEARKP